MGLEQKINGILQKHPTLKRKIKYFYQKINIGLSKPKKYEGNIIKLSPNDNQNDYFFGYYDKSPWDITGRYVLCLKVKDASKNVAPSETAEIMLIDTKNNNKIQKIAETNAWNVQQGCMLQWLGPNYDSEIIYNDFRNNKFCSIILNVFNGTEKILCKPVYSVSSNGKFGLGLDFSRLHSYRPGYGYSNLEDASKNVKLPNGECIYYVDFDKNTSKEIVNYRSLFALKHRKDMDNAIHKVNHIMINPTNQRFMFMHRWYNGDVKISRLITSDINGKNLFVLSDDNLVSHYFWKNENEIIAFENKKGHGLGYYIMMDKTNSYRKINEYIDFDGHPSYFEDDGLILTDSYPNRKRISTLRLMNEKTSVIIGKVFNSFDYDNETRCDLHPRWSRDGKEICFDACYEGKRGLYKVPISDIKFSSINNIGTQISQKGKYKILFILNTCRKCGPTQVVFNIIKKLDYSKFDPVILTISEENTTTNLKEIYPYISNHYFLKLSKKDILFGRLKKLDLQLLEIQPDIIHTTGVFPDYAVSKLKKYKHVMTMHNYVYDAYIAQFGKLKGTLLSKMQLYAVKHSSKTVTCSKSLANIYSNRLGLNFDYIQNGIDITKYKKSNNRIELRQKLNLKREAYIFIYTGQFLKIKNIEYILNGFVELYKNDSFTILLLLGDGPEFLTLKSKFGKYKNILFMGNVQNVEEYLSGSDAYISSSLSEGLPNGVLEAMSCKLPVLLSNIPQHLEILNADKKCGYSFSLDNIDELLYSMQQIRNDSNIAELANNAHEIVKTYFSDYVMSQKYQQLYLNLIKDGEVNGER